MDSKGLPLCGVLSFCFPKLSRCKPHTHSLFINPDSSHGEGFFSFSLCKVEIEF